MYNPFIEDEFQKRLNEDPTFYVRYVKSRIAEMDKKLNDYIKQEDERLTKQLKNRPPKPRSTINGPRTAIKKPLTADRGPQTGRRRRRLAFQRALHPARHVRGHSTPANAARARRPLADSGVPVRAPFSGRPRRDTSLSGPWPPRRRSTSLRTSRNCCRPMKQGEVGMYIPCVRATWMH